MHSHPLSLHELGASVSQFFQVHPENPQARLIKQAVEIIRGGGVVVYPTDSSYALGCMIGDKNAVERIRRLRQLDDKHNFTLVCRDLSQIGLFAKVDTAAFRLLKQGRQGGSEQQGGEGLAHGDSPCLENLFYDLAS